MPMVVLPNGHADKVSAKGPEQCRAHNDFPDRVVQEFKKTASKVQKHPWCLTRAAEYLLELLRTNKLPPNPENLPTIDVFKSYSRVYMPLPQDSCMEWHDFAPGTPKRVLFGPEAPAAKLRRLRVKTKVAGCPMPKAPVAQGAPVLGCSKCRRSPNGCIQCRRWAAAAAAAAADTDASAAAAAGTEAAAPVVPADGTAGAAEDGGAAEAVPEATATAASTPRASASAPGTPCSVLPLEVELESMIEEEQDDDEVSLMHRWFTFCILQAIIFYGAKTLPHRAHR